MSFGRPDLGGRTALVTGAARRLGRHLAEELAACGATVFVHFHRSESEAARVVDGIVRRGGRAYPVQADLLDPDAADGILRAVADATGRLDVLVNNVGNYPRGPVEESTPAEWRETLEANLIAPLALSQAALAHFPPEGGQIVNIGYAGVDLLRPNPNATAYQVSKTGLLILTKSLAQRLGPRGVRVNMISPGQLENSVDLPAEDELAARIPLGRPGRLEDISRALLFLLQPDSYVTGVNLDVAGGYRPPSR
ncbi:MAG: SDR family oxidoreductase [Planctomycetota bacterium]